MKETVIGFDAKESIVCGRTRSGNVGFDEKFLRVVMAGPLRLAVGKSREASDFCRQAVVVEVFP